MKKLPERYSYFHKFTETPEEKSEESKFLLFYSYTYMFELSLMPLGNSKFQYLIAANSCTFLVDMSWKVWDTVTDDLITF